MRRWPEAEERYQAALAFEERAKAPPWVAHVLYDYGVMLELRGRSGDRQRVRDLYEQAFRIATQLGMENLQRKLRRQGLE
jgi:hypothetical protein